MRTSKLMSAVAVSAVLLLAGCGGTSGTAATSAAPSGNGVADLTADQILATTTEAAKAQSSVHVAGKGTSGGQAIALDVHLRQGGGGYGTITLGANALQIVSPAPRSTSRATRHSGPAPRARRPRS